MNPEPVSERIRVLLVDDSELVRTGLRTLLSVEPTFTVVGEAGTIADGVADGLRLRPDVVLLDIRLPDGSGIDACRQILKGAPDTRVLMVTSVVDDAVVDDAIRAGAHGYLLKEIDGRGLVNAIRDVAAGRSILDPAVTARVIQLVKSVGPGRDPLAVLSPPERQILGLIATGHTNKEVGVNLGLNEKTVRNHISMIFEKLHVTRRAEAAAIYARKSRPE
jgi:two-component system response regulator DevR